MDHYKNFVDNHKRHAYFLNRTAVDEDNYEACKIALQELSESKAELYKNAHRYPTEICFGGLRYVLDSKRDIDIMLFVLEGKIKEYEDQ